MTKKILGVTLIASAFLFVGCGGSSGGSSSDSPAIPDVDNSTLSVGTNSMGYYGPNVILGSHTVKGSWSLADKSSVSALSIKFGDTSIVEKIENGGTEYWEYGVSGDGREIMFDDEMRITIYFASSGTCYDSHLENVFTGEGLDTVLCKK